MRSDLRHWLAPAAVLSLTLPLLLAGLLSLSVPLWLPLAAAAFTAAVSLAASRRLPWLPALWAAVCGAVLLILRRMLTGGLAALLNAALAVWRQIFPRVYPVYDAPEDTAGLTLLLTALAVLWGLWSAHYVRRPTLPAFLIPAVLLAAAAVVFAPAAPLWWTALCALTLLLLYALRFGRGEGSALRAWGRAALALLLTVTLLGGWDSAAAHPAWLDTGRGALSAALDRLRYGDNAAAGLPEGDLSAAGPLRRADTPMLTVTMTDPASCYLRGFVGETYTDGRWTALDRRTLSDSAETFRWLHEAGFRPLTQLTSAASAAAPALLERQNTVAVENTAASSKYLYAPYELGYDTTIPDGDAVGEAALTASGLRGTRRYTFSAANGLLTQYRRLGAALAEDTASNAAFLDAEAAYNRFVYDRYTAVPDDIRRFLTGKLSGWQREEGQTHFDVQRAKQNILFYLTTYITYDEDAASAASGADPLLTFLDGSQTGYDVQYASAAVMMFRYYGIPARYVEGFLVTKDAAASLSAGESLTLTGQSGHAWVEYYQDGVGWLPFEVTPPYMTAMEQAESFHNVSGLVGQAPPETEENEQPDTPDTGLTQALREFWLKHRLTILLTVTALLAAAAVTLFTGWLVWERKKTARRKARFQDPDAAAAIDAIYRYLMDVLLAQGVPALNAPPAAYAPYLDEDLRDAYLDAAALWEQARFSAGPMTEEQRRRVLRLKDQVWDRVWHRAGLGERLRLKYKEFL